MTEHEFRNLKLDKRYHFETYTGISYYGILVDDENAEYYVIPSSRIQEYNSSPLTTSQKIESGIMIKIALEILERWEELDK